MDERRTKFVRRSLIMGSVLALALATTGSLVVLSKAEHDIRAMFPRADGTSLTFHTLSFERRSILVLAFRWSDETGQYTAYWGLRHWSVVDAPGYRQR